ncbi:major facilitator transporter [Caballeronia udeis]|uniref:Major facilitator transporter n=1 Tax=Caballeronia udeis TaxID=1232866 RepID=A0A158J031_9BURK|nr:major facilitator transporter [Caballeronia udeis]
MLAEASIGYRLDRLPLSRFHGRLLGLVAAGMFLDSFDIYIAGSVLAALIHDASPASALE